MYENVGSHVRVGVGLSDKFEVRVGVHQDSVLSALLLSSYLRLCHESLQLEYLGRTFMQITQWKNVSADC